MKSFVKQEQEKKDCKELCSPLGIRVMKETHTPNNTGNPGGPDK